MLVASAIWPAARAKLGFLTPAVALVALITPRLRMLIVRRAAAG
jgi:hypothetical protein